MTDQAYQSQATNDDRLSHLDAQHQAMFTAAEHAMENAYAPYSGFRVGVAMITDQGEIFSGCNVENASYGLTGCAERSTIGTMITRGQRRVMKVLVLSSGERVCTPCGACRQLIAEFAAADTPIICHANEKQFETFTLSSLLPHQFGSNTMQADGIDSSNT